MTTKWSRRDYRMVADVLYEARMLAEEAEYGDNGTIARIAQMFEARFAADNARFDRDRFERAVYRDHEEG